MILPAHIVERIAAVLAKMGTEGFHVDNEAARHGGIALMGTIGATWLMRPDGTFWDVDDDFGKPLSPLPPEYHVTALVSGAKRYPWLAELLPRRPPDAIVCGTCRGHGEIRIADAAPKSHGLICSDCRALGWRPAT